MTLSYVQIEERHIVGFHAVLDEVAREHAWLAMAAAPPIERTAAFVRANIEHRYPQLVALDADTVVGWSDVTPRERRNPGECGILGMGLLAGYRGRGHGLRLIEAVIEAARARGFGRIELTVNSSNQAAIALYRRVGFVAPGAEGEGRGPGEFFVMMLDLAGGAQ